MTTLRIPILATPRNDGEGKTQNKDPNQIHRRDILNREDAYFHTNIEMTVCIHGVWDKKNNDMTPASFIVFTCEATSLHEFKTRKLKLEVDFVNVEGDTDGTDSQRPMSNMSIVARGPQVISRYNKTKVSMRRERGVDGEIGADVIVKPGINLHQLSSQEWEAQYFEEAKSGVRHASSTDHRYTKVWWIFTENRKSRAGVSPGFRIAILLKRETNEPFKGHVAITEFDAGWRHKGAVAWHDFFSKKDPEAEKDNVIDAINFDPTANPIRPKWLNNVDADQLGDLETEAGIDKQYARVWGVDL
ncbi:hypothetical protein GGS26DRAFT_594986 [Hypomontagnella submonticulosa]|nr:hypothetical protein GGS26DRAFT_594986 [Hypomontagnella submonticulosa]